MNKEELIISVGGKKINPEQLRNSIPPEAAQLLFQIQKKTAEEQTKDMLPNEAVQMLALMQEAMSFGANKKEEVKQSSPTSDEALQLLAKMQTPLVNKEQLQVEKLKQKNEEDIIRKISTTDPYLKETIQREKTQHDVETIHRPTNNESSAPVNQEQSLVRSMPAELQRAYAQKRAIEKLRNETNPIKKFTIYEAGIAFGIIVGKTKKNEVVELMKAYSKVNFEANDSSLMFTYEDISFIVFFDDDNTVVELNFAQDYKGSTEKGLRVGDTIDKAIEIYGQPRMKSPRGAIWDKFGVFSKNNLIVSIRIQK